MSGDIFSLLSEPVRRYIRDKRWTEFRAIQVSAIKYILGESGNFILAARTASGKTEAAFLPILTDVDFLEPGIQVLYISPLIALINDQFTRVEDLCEYMDIPVTKWHGEANRGEKKSILKDPHGILLITPESIEAMFVTKPYNVTHLFSNLKYVVIDEVHSFLGTDRGVQLKSLLYRLQEKNVKPFRIIGLSATIGDYDEAKRFTGDEKNTKVLVDKQKRITHVEFRYFSGEDKTELPLELVKDLYRHVHDIKSLIFPNSRGRVEEISVKLNKISERVGGHGNYYAHHSSVDKGIREYVEFFAKNNRRESFSIACTSTLELGVDIGTVDEIIQVDATYSVSSLIQRAGRSGRRSGASSKLVLYATTRWDLLQALACWSLYDNNYIEAPEIIKRPYDILGHQLLSIIKENSGIDYRLLIEKLLSNFAFQNLNQSDIVEIINHFIQLDFIEKLGNELIIGIEGERVVNNMHFYSMFERDISFSVIYNSRVIGELPFSVQSETGNNILLAARIWKITEVDLKSRKIYVIPAKDGKKPLFMGVGGNVHPMIQQEIFRILLSEEEFAFLDESSLRTLNDLRSDFKRMKIKDYRKDRPVIINQNGLIIHVFGGTKIIETIKFLLNLINFKSNIINLGCSIETNISDWNMFISSMNSLLSYKDECLLNSAIEKRLEEPVFLEISKWGKFLPDKPKVDLIKQKLFDFEGAFKFIENTSFKANGIGIIS